MLLAFLEPLLLQLQDFPPKLFLELQNLLVEKFDLQEVHVVESDDKPIDCFYTINGTRKDVDHLEVEQDAD